ncbi:MAG: aminoacyl-tRNA hydrolase [Syntrophomonadaceae bacterium]|jgi:PTH1 family peptidyl-tRNA hydrolase
MKIVVGLGNPGSRYRGTRHNMGYMVVDQLAHLYKVEREESRFDSLIGHLTINSEKVLLVKPLTYMNLSGKAVAPLVNWYKLDLSHLLVVYDDMDIAAGDLRIRASGGAGGHKGLKSVIEMLGSQDFPRVRVGIGRPVDNSIDWVLGHFAGQEKEELTRVIERAANAVITWVSHGIDKAMNEYN